VGTSLSFSVATYNLLANAYIKRGWYPRSPAIVLDPAWRIPILTQYVSALNADLLCLQELEGDVLANLRGTLGALGYDVYYTPKAAHRPDGVAIFYRKEKFAAVRATRLVYADGEAGEPDSGYVALFALLRTEDRSIGVINTHLLWDGSVSALELQRGYRQARQLLVTYEEIASLADAWILAGDLNVTPDSALVAMIRQAGFEYSHHSVSAAATCNVNGLARMIDYIFHSSTLSSEPADITPVDDLTILPSADQPSDHVAVAARMAWKHE
jgi:mRNA deadenylase 3'-5' endonuclease subunit Ccr4